MVINDNDDDVDDSDSDFCWFFIVYSETCPEELKAFSWLYNMTLFCWLIFFVEYYVHIPNIVKLMFDLCKQFFI